MAKRSDQWMQWGSAMTVVATVLVGVPEAGWGQQAKPDEARLEAAQLHEQAIKLYDEGNYDDAIASAERSLSIFEKVLSPDHPHVALSLDSLALLYDTKGDYVRAEPLHQRALAIREKVLGSDHPEVALSLTDLARLYYAKGDYARAEPLYQRALVIREKALGPDHPDVAQLLNDLAALYYSKGDHMRAEPLYQRAQSIWEKALGKDHPNVAASLNNLALLYDKNGDYARAEPLYQRALFIFEKALGPDHPKLAQSLNNLAMLYYAKGDYARAEPLVKRALAIFEKWLGPDHPEVATALNALAVIYFARGDVWIAEPLYQRALAIKEKALGPNHPAVSTSLNNLAGLYQAKGDFARAEPLYQRALIICEKALGPNHPAVSPSLNNLALLYKAKGDYSRAEPLMQRALSISEKALGPDHPDMAISLDNLGTLHWAQHDIPRALQALEQAISIEDHNAARELAVGADEQRRAYMQKLGGTTEGTISFHLDSASSLEPAKQLVLRTILRRKGLVLDAMANSFANLRERLSPTDKEKFDTWRLLSAQYSALVQRGPDPKSRDEFPELLKQVDNDRQKSENELSHVSKGLQAQIKSVTVQQVQIALPEDSALVELYWYRPFNPKAKGTENKWGSPRFVAYVLHPNGQIDFADLGDAKLIEDAVKTLRRDLARVATEPKANAQRLHQLVWAPIQKLLGNTKHIYLSPDGELNLIPFESLVDDSGHYVVESYSITYLPTGRDLIRRGDSVPSRSPAIVFAGPNYEMGTTPETPPRHVFEPLRYAQEEADAIVKSMPGTSVLTGAEATEVAIKALKAPKFLHISTHGFLAKNEGALHADPAKKVRWFENPLSKSGLAFAGANRSSPRAEYDGLLTALEAAQLDLYGTKLVVLSACNTGNGTVENGDSVYGLRRAFAIAGAETTVMSLWQVDGGATTALMKSYYAGLAASGGRTEALRQAQLAMLSNPNTAHPHYWASFIVSGDDRSMEGRDVVPSFPHIKPGMCGACEIGVAQETSAFGWLSVFMVGAVTGMRRRTKTK